MILNLREIAQCAVHFIVHQTRYVITWLLSGGKRTEKTVWRKRQNKVLSLFPCGTCSALR